MRPLRIFRVQQPLQRVFGWGDVVVLIGVAVLIYIGARLALSSPVVVSGPTISLDPNMLPVYTVYSVGRMVAAYVLSMFFTLIYGYAAANNRRAEQILMPVLDILQSIPVLSFLPVVLLSLSAILPQGLALELSAIVLIFTGQVWNLTFAWYQSLIVIPKELREASATFRFNSWLRFKVVALPFGAISLIWNSMMSWSGGWFFLMAAETFSVGERDFRLPGLGSYLKEAAHQGDVQAILFGIGTLVLVIVLLDQLVWRPLLAWSDRFKVETVESDYPPTSWFYDALHASRLVGWFRHKVALPLGERLDVFLLRRFPVVDIPPRTRTGLSWKSYLFGLVVAVVVLWGVYESAQLLLGLPLPVWGDIVLGVVATLLRVTVALVIALLWTVPLGVAIGTNPRIAAFLQPIVQITASIPATALFPVLLLALLHLPGGLEVGAVLLMLMGTQWYVLFNIIAGASAIPQDLKYTTTMLGLRHWQRWRILILPALFPYIITGAITASGGAWNASIVAEYVQFAGETLQTDRGIGAVIAHATADADYPLLLAGTIAMVLTVVMINRLVWRRLYRLAEERYRME